ncbi:MAG: hypothetical protein ACI8QS_000760 [Planctomycetota bacterium]|jgi:hypothetical protein
MLLHASQRAQRAAPERRGVVLLLSFLVLLVLILILQQIDYSTKTSARVVRNEQTLGAMDLAIESTLMSVFDNLKADGEADASSGEEGGEGAGGLGGLGADPGAALGGGEEGGGPSDSHMDDWWGVNRQDFSVMDDIRVRVLIQDEDSKFNLLGLLVEDDDEAERAFERLARIIELSRKGTDEEIDSGRARSMAEKIREVLERRTNEVLPQPILMTDDEENEERSMLSSLRELVAIEPLLFEEDYFRDYLDERGEVVHSLGSFLTVWSSLTTAQDLGNGAAGPGAAPEIGGSPEDGSADLPDSLGDGSDAAGGTDPAAGAGEGPSGLVNVNTAPIAVLAGLLDERDVPYDLWESVLRYRNERDESEEDPEEDIPLDEFGEEIFNTNVFDALTELAETDTWNDLDPLVQAEIEGMLTVQSQVFSIFLTAYKPTGEQEYTNRLPTREETENEEAEGIGLLRTVRAVVWRRDLGDGTVDIVPLVRWEVLDYVPYEVLDFPPDELPDR